MDDLQFAVELDKHLEKQHEDALEREILGNLQSRRPRARMEERTFADLQVGDYITAEPSEGSAARWAKVVALNDVNVKPKEEGQMTISLKPAQPLGVGLHDRFVIDRYPHELVVVDAS